MKKLRNLTCSGRVRDPIAGHGPAESKSINLDKDIKKGAN